MAGMALWFPHECCKTVAWYEFPNATLLEGSCLTLGTCDVSAPHTVETEKAKEAMVVAWKGHKIWNTKVMFGAILTPHCFTCTLFGGVVR